MWPETAVPNSTPPRIVHQQLPQLEIGPHRQIAFLAERVLQRWVAYLVLLRHQYLMRYRSDRCRWRRRVVR